MVAATFGWGLLSLSALVSSGAAGVAHSGVALLALGTAVILARSRSLRRAVPLALGLYAAGLTVATLASGLLTVDPDRVQLFTGNPNTLGAALVIAFTAWAAVAPLRRLVWLGWPLVALAVLYTGSRTAGGSLLAAGTVWVIIHALRGRRSLALAPVVALAFIAAAAFAWQRAVVEVTPNLLAAPSDLNHADWRHDLAETVTVVEAAVPGPLPGTTAQRLIARARPESRSLVHQSLGRSEMGVPYVASVYLRADAPQRIVVSSHLATETCEVDVDWHRCVTPVGYGDDYHQRQFHLLAEQRGGSVDVYVFGAQYEQGSEVTPFLDARPAWIPQPMVRRFDLRRLTLVPSDRVPLWEAGLAIAAEHPWFGVGVEASRTALQERTQADYPAPALYAHNLVVQLLMVHGLVGLLGFALIVVALLSTLSPTGWGRLAPMLIALALLNTWDLTFFHPTVFAAALVATAYWTGERVSLPPG